MWRKKEEVEGSKCFWVALSPSLLGDQIIKNNKKNLSINKWLYHTQRWEELVREANKKSTNKPSLSVKIKKEYDPSHSLSNSHHWLRPFSFVLSPDHASQRHSPLPSLTHDLFLPSTMIAHQTPANPTTAHR